MPEDNATEAKHRLAEFFIEQGRRALLEGQAVPAAVYLSQVYQE